MTQNSPLSISFVSRRGATFPFRRARPPLPVFFLVGFFFLLQAGVAVAQIPLRGIVVDSLTVEVLPYVNITIKNKGPGAVSDIRGSFEFEAGEGDTIVFSRVGYVTRMLPANFVSQMVLVFLKEERRMLEPIEIEDKQPSWLPDLPPESPWKNQTFKKSFTETPGFQGVQTFGPGFVFRMPGSGFKKEARARQKLRELQVENDKAKDYIHLVNSTEIKGKLMKEYGLSEDDFYQLLGIFNERNGAFIYKLETHEVIPLLLQFFADEVKRKEK